MTIPYNITRKQRKQLAENISVALHTIPKYLGYPTCNYQIGDCTLERDGKLIIPDCVADETATALLEHLRSRIYAGEAVETEDRLTISMLKGLFTKTEIETLQQIVTNTVSVCARKANCGVVSVAASSARIMLPETYGLLSMCKNSWGTSMRIPVPILNQS